MEKAGRLRPITRPGFGRRHKGDESMTNPILIDVALAAVLILFIWLGARKGFILTLCSLVAVVVALVGANLIADALAPTVAQVLQPKLETIIQESLEEKALEVSATDSLAVTDALAALREKGGLYEWAADGLEEVLKNTPGTDAIAHQAAVAASALAEQVARGILFSVAFLLVLIAWTVLSHALDLVSKLPVINSLNHTLGGVIGGVKGLLILYIAAWVLCSLTGKISPETAEKTYLLSFLLQHSPLDLLSLV